MRHLQTCQGHTHENCWSITILANPNMEMGRHQYGLYCGITQDRKRVWLYLGYWWSAHENCSLSAGQDILPDIYLCGVVHCRILSLHGVPKTIVSDRGPQFVSKFWEELHKSLGTKLLHSSAYHPQTSGQTERVNQILEDMLRACVLDFSQKWDECLPLAEFSYNNSYQVTIRMAPYEALYGRKCWSPIY